MLSKVIEKYSYILIFPFIIVNCLTFYILNLKHNILCEDIKRKEVFNEKFFNLKISVLEKQILKLNSEQNMILKENNDGILNFMLEHPIIASGGLIFVILGMYKSYKIVSTPLFYLSYLFGSGTPVQQQISSEITIIPTKTQHLEAQESEILENIIFSNLALIDPEKSFEQNNVSDSILSFSHSFYECFGEEEKADFIEENISFDLREPTKEISESEAQSIEARLDGEKIIKEAAEIAWENQKLAEINLILENKYQMLNENIDQVTSSFF